MIYLHTSVFDHPVIGAGKPVAPADPGRPAFSPFEAFVDLSFRLFEDGVLPPDMHEQWNWPSEDACTFLEAVRDYGLLDLIRNDEDVGYQLAVPPPQNKPRHLIDTTGIEPWRVRAWQKMQAVEADPSLSEDEKARQMARIVLDACDEGGER